MTASCPAPALSALCSGRAPPYPPVSFSGSSSLFIGRIKSFITEKDGGYRFHNLTPNIDYEIYAEYQGQKSGAKTLSSFDNRNNVTLNIRIDVK